MFELGDIRRLLDAFERSDWEEIHLSTDGMEVHISATGTGTPIPAPRVGPATEPVAAPVAEPAALPPAPEPIEDLTVAPIDTVAPGVASADGYAIVSPSPGIFWRSPSPGAPPFVDVGQRVTPETTVCIVEVMKLMNQVHAGVSGTVQAILVANGGTVERDQPMVLVELDGA
jgi:acetyl-CoA carboxylase biotin carboxyl carrier protein